MNIASKKTIYTTLLGAASLGLTSLSYAQQMQRPHGPPPEALQACSGQAVNNACSFQSRRGDNLQGQCMQTPRGELACRPEGHRPRGMRQGGQGQRQQGQRPQRGQRQAQQQGQGRQNGQRRGPRTHTVTQSSGNLSLVAANQNPPTQGQVSINIQGGFRVIQSNGISQHLTGAFPNSGNPNRISAQNNQFRVPLNPQFTGRLTELRRGPFGVGVNGVTFEPGAGEVYDGARDWNYEALSGAIPLGIDANYAHVQPTGKYHYHGLPTGLMRQLGVNANQHSPVIGWAADGFPIYAIYSYRDNQSAQSGVGKQTSSYRLKQGQRPGGNQPSGTYDGTFVKDYQFVNGAGTLDECNGRFVKTPDFPQGTYAYFLTETFPVVPRCFKGTPSQDFKARVPGLR